MAITLLESAKLSQNTLKRGVATTFVQNASVLQMMPFMDIVGNAYTYNEEKTLPGVAFRGVNEGYEESTGTVNPKTESLVILGGDADTDKYIAQTRSNINDQRAVQTALKTKALAFQFQDSFFNGDTATNAKSFDGLKKRLTGGQVINADTNGLSIGTDTVSMNRFMEALDALIYQVQGKADALFMDSKTLLKVKSIARQLGYFDNTVDAFGRSVFAYDGVPFFEAGETVDGSKVIGHEETQGEATNTTSIYAVKFGADEFVSGLTNGGVQVYDIGELESKPAYRTRIEFYTGIGIFNGKSAARLKGLIV
ncbi:major capsid protein [Halalkalibacter sp. APA_J-10(15)]|uniref:major capsid protein n=1 Tax=Halalkalibacter sp. APA_J-10(15) TaxID=2933805 RepID=UPI001FF3FC45|nr:phage major capsid protein [Halalkalibacter sp. APA_J-10(15)]MCK0470886.1 phage major capsid protein [Halalkalibacter sp. APA_J-10(15)]